VQHVADCAPCSARSSSSTPSAKAPLWPAVLERTCFARFGAASKLIGLVFVWAPSLCCTRPERVGLAAQARPDRRVLQKTARGRELVLSWLTSRLGAVAVLALAASLGLRPRRREFLISHVSAGPRALQSAREILCDALETCQAMSRIYAFRSDDCPTDNGEVLELPKQDSHRAEHPCAGHAEVGGAAGYPSSLRGHWARVDVSRFAIRTQSAGSSMTTPFPRAGTVRLGPRLAWRRIS
jgi:hypothetical protein